MQSDPIQEWQRLTEHYRRMSDDELRDLAFDFADLTETARQALRDEMRSRRLGDPEEADSMRLSAAVKPQMTHAPRRNLDGSGIARETTPVLTDSLAVELARSPVLVPDEPDDRGDTDATGSHDYTWKTVLCECDTTEQARELAESLREAGLDSWVQGPREFGLRYARVLVAADQLEQARAIADKPIPPRIIDDSKIEVPEYEPPRCPRCRTEDPVLESVDPVNTWRCEQCGAEWSELTGDRASSSAETPEKAG